MKRLSQRGEIRVGFRCNARCGFCYYQDMLGNPKKKEPTTAQLQERLRALRREGATEVEFTGGEPTIRPDLIELVKSAKQIGFVNISIITNGLKLASSRYANRLINAGANDFLFSIHGHTSEIHDAHTGIPGSFVKVLKAVRNIQSEGPRCRSTTTVTGENYQFLEPLVHKLIESNMKCIHLAVFSPVAQARNANKNMFVRYSESAKAIKMAIEKYKNNLPLLSVKYIPFCFMKGYEKYVMNLYQQSFDPDDWNYYFSNKIRRTHGFIQGAVFDAIVSMGFCLSKDCSFAVKQGWQGIKIFGLIRLVELLRKKRPKACRQCRYDIVCDHVWREYIAHYGDGEFSPIPGTKVRNPIWCYDFSGYRLPGVSVADCRYKAGN